MTGESEIGGKERRGVGRKRRREEKKDRSSLGPRSTHFPLAHNIAVIGWTMELKARCAPTMTSRCTCSSIKRQPGKK